MDDTVILMNEVENDGKTVHLYLSPLYKNYVAYGISAYIVSRVVSTVECGYDYDAQMPMVKLDGQQLAKLGMSTCQTVSIQREHAQLKVEHIYDEEGYDRWASFVRSQYAQDDLFKI